MAVVPDRGRVWAQAPVSSARRNETRVAKNESASRKRRISRMIDGTGRVVSETSRTDVRLCWCACIRGRSRRGLKGFTTTTKIIVGGGGGRLLDDRSNGHPVSLYCPSNEQSNEPPPRIDFLVKRYSVCRLL